jgi:NADPH-dependent curcumin reductase
MADTNRRWILAARPKGRVGREHFAWREEPVPEIGEGEFLLRNLWLSCDPAQRAWMEMDTYVPAIPLGDVMHSGSAGEVVESRHPGFAKGDLVSGAFGWQDYAVNRRRRPVPGDQGSRGRRLRDGPVAARRDRPHRPHRPAVRRSGETA